MSNTVDSRVVEMRFDNKNFESNVATSMSTLDKLKQKLNLSGASKGLDNLNNAAKKCDLSGMSKGIETVNAKFSTMQVVGMTAISKITNAAMNAGSKMISALTTTPITDGLKEYELQIDSVQTIMANTGDDVKTVNAALDELNNYADLTIYNFAEMTKNAGTFTAALGKGSLNDTMDALKGIGNWAAYAGASSSDMSRATFQLSQALSQGSIRLQDWMSIEHTAGMAGKNFQEAFKNTAKSMGTDVDAIIAKNGNFRESLRDNWLTTEVFMKTMKQFADDQAMTDAATKVKTFTQLIDTLQEALGTGWATTWRLIIGDFEEAKSMWTSVSDVLGGFINTMSDARNAVLESAMGKGFSNLSKQFVTMLGPAQKATTEIKKTVDTVSNLGKTVDDVLIGKFGNGKDRFDALTKAGQNYYRVQNEVNKKLDNAKRYTKEQIAEQDKLLGVKTKTETVTKKEAQSTSKLTDEQKKQVIALADMSNEQLRAKGYTEQQIKAFDELRSTADRLGLSVKDFVTNIDEINGRWLLIGSFKNIGQGIIKIFSSIGQAWKETMKPITGDDLFNGIAAFHKFTSQLIITDETANNLKRTFKGLFALLDIVTTIAGGGMRIAFKLLTGIMGACGVSFLDVTAILGDFIVGIRDFLFSNNLIISGFKLLASGVKMVVSTSKELIQFIGSLPQVQKALEAISKIDLNKIGANVLESLKNSLEDLSKIDFKSIGINILNNIKDALEDLSHLDLSGVGSNIIQGLRNGLEGGLGSIPGILIRLGTNIVSAICGVLGIHSPSTVMYDIGMNIIKGLYNGIRDGISMIVSIITQLATKIFSTIKGIEWEKVFVGATTIGLALAIKEIAGILDKFASPFEGVGSILESVSEVISASTKKIKKILGNTAKVIKSFSKVLNAKSWQMKASAIKDMAIALAILAASVYVLAQLDRTKLIEATVTIGVLAGVLVAISIAMDKCSGISGSFKKGKFDIKGLKTGLISLGIAILLVAATAKLLGGMNPTELEQGFTALGAIVVAIAAVYAAFGTFVKGAKGKNMEKAGTLLTKMAKAMLIMAIVAKIVGTLSPTAMVKGALFMGAFNIFTQSMVNTVRLGGVKYAAEAGKMMTRMAKAMMLMVIVAKLAETLSAEQMLKGAGFMAAFVVFTKGMVWAVKTESGEMAKIGSLMLAVSNAMLLMVGVVKLAGKLNRNEMLKGAGFALAFLVFMKAIVNIVKMDSKQQIAKVGGIMLSMSAALLLMVGAAKLAGMLSASDILKGAVVIAGFVAMMKIMIKAVRDVGPDAGKMAGTLIGISVAIGIMAGICVLVSMIDTASLAKGLIVVGLLSAMMTAMIWATRGASDCMKNLIVMTSAIAVMAGAVALLSMLDTKKLAGATACLAGLMATFGIMSKLSSNTNGSLKSMLSMVAVVGALALVCGLLASLPIESTLSSAAALSMLLLSMTASISVLSKVGSVSKNALKSLAVMSAIMAVLGGVLGLLNKYDLTADLQTAASLSTIMIALATSCAILGRLGNLTGDSAANAAKLMVAVAGVATVLTAVAGLIDLIPGAEKFLDGGIVVLQKIGYGLGSFLGSIVGGFSAGATSGLPEVAQNLRAFMDAFQGMDSSSLKGIETLSDAILTITAADLMSKITQFLADGKDPIKKFVEDVKTLAKGFAEIAAELNGYGTIDTSALTNMADVAKSFAKVQDSISGSGGILQKIIGEQDLGNFGEQVGSYVKNLVTALNSVGDLGNIDVGDLKNLVKIGNAFSDLQSTIQPTNSLYNALLGTKNLGDFGSQIASYVSQIKKVAESFSGAEHKYLKEFDGFVSVGEAMQKLQKTVEPAGGLVQLLTGQQDLSIFGTQVSEYIEQIKMVADTMTGQENINLESVNSFVEAGKAMATLQESIPKKKFFDGTVDLSSFGEQIKNYATAIASFATSVVDVDTEKVTQTVAIGNTLVTFMGKLTDLDTSGLSAFDNVSDVGNAIGDYASAVAGIDTGTVSESISAATRLRKFVNTLADFDASGITNFKVGTLGKAIANYASSVSGFNAAQVTSSIAAAKKLKSFIESLAGMDTSGVSKFKNAISELGKTNISAVASTFNKGTSKITSAGKNLTKSLASGVNSNSSSVTSAATKMVSSMQKSITSNTSSFSSSGSKLIMSFVKGLNSKKSLVTAASRNIATAAASASRTGHGTMVSNGSYLGSGLIIGVRSKISAAYAAGYALGRAAVRGEKDGQNSNSPSKDTIKAGHWLGEGLVIGIYSMVKAATKAGRSMGQATSQSISDAVSSAATIFDMSADSTPTIRPVVDLSDIKDQASIVGSLFSNPTLTPTSDIRAISTLMSENRQNGNEDVVSAINKLRKGLDNVGNTYNNINGVTYDDGSNINDAVETIFRAARVEGRR